MTYSVEEAQRTSEAGADVVFLSIFSPDYPYRLDWRGNQTRSLFTTNYERD